MHLSHIYNYEGNDRIHDTKHIYSHLPDHIFKLIFAFVLKLENVNLHKNKVL